jgi:predicted permease
MFRDLQAAPSVQQALTGIAAHRSFQTNIALDGETVSGSGMLVSGNYFALLGLAPAAGRLLIEGDDAQLGAGRVAVLSHAYWRNALGGDAGVLGRSIQVNGEAMEIVGVAPEGFEGTTFGIRPQVFVPISSRWLLQPQSRADHDDRMSYWVYLFARLAPGVEPAQAHEALNVPYSALLRDIELPLHDRFDEGQREQFLARRIEIESGDRGQSSVALSARTPMLLLQAAAFLVLLVACLNIANLLLARGAARAGEFAIRASIGASRGRLLRQLLVEAAALALCGAALSLPLASAAIQGLLAYLPGNTGASLSARLDGAALVFAAGLALLTVVLFGLLPSLQVAAVSTMSVLRGDSANSTSTRAAARFRAALATAQVGFSMAALALAGLFAQSLVNLGRVELGMQVENVASFSVSPGRSGYSPERSVALFDRLETEIAALPGVHSVSLSIVPLITGSDWGSNVSVEGYEPGPETTDPFFNEIGDDYFTTLGIPLLAGRSFSALDSADGARVAIINRRFAEHYGLGANPIGKRMATGRSEDLDIEIVGLVADSKYSRVKEEDPIQFFLPRRQNPDIGEVTVYVRSQGEPQELLAGLARIAAGIDPNLPLESLRTMPQTIAQNLAVDHFVGSLAAAFAVLATALAALGLYGVLSYTLSQRQREIGLRMALGAAPSRLASMLMAQVGRLAGVGMLLGLVVAVALGRAAQSLLFGLQGHDPLVLLSAMLVLAVIAFATAWMPARRAARMDPMLALRHD